LKRAAHPSPGSRVHVRPMRSTTGTSPASRRSCQRNDYPPRGHVARVAGDRGRSSSPTCPTAARHRQGAAESSATRSRGGRGQDFASGSPQLHQGVAGSLRRGQAGRLMRRRSPPHDVGVTGMARSPSIRWAALSGPTTPRRRGTTARRTSTGWERSAMPAITSVSQATSP
jgi:hypothetical protein